MLHAGASAKKGNFLFIAIYGIFKQRTQTAINVFKKRSEELRK